jgi:hypothetical protein
MSTTPPYSTADTSFQTTGRESSLIKRVADFYEAMSTGPRTAAILAKHTENLKKVLGQAHLPPDRPAQRSQYLPAQVRPDLDSQGAQPPPHG